MLKDLITMDQFIEIVPSFKISYNYQITLKTLSLIGSYEDDVVIKCDDINKGLQKLEDILIKRKSNLE
jgi:hypothetical protein